MKYQPDEQFRKHLNQQGIRGKRFKLDAEKHAEKFAEFRDHPAYQNESDEELHHRVAYALLWPERRKHNAKWYLKWLIAALILLAALFFCSRAEAQVDAVRIEDNSGATVKQWAGGIAKIKCGTNLTCTNSSGTVTVVSSATADSNKPFIDVQRDCGAAADGTTDDYTLVQACLNQYPQFLFYFPPTKTDGSCSYMFGSTLKPKGAGTTLMGASAGYANGNTTQGGTTLCWANGVTGIELDLTGQSCSGCNIRDISMYGNASTNHLVTPTLLNMPSGANLPLFTRSIASIQRASNVLTVTVTAANGAGSEALTQQVSSTVKITGVVGDATMNGNCVISALSGLDSAGGNPTTFTCPQNGADAGPFTTDGQLMLPTTGASTADGILVCTNFATIIHVVVANFGRHGINADSSSADANCPTPFSDDLIIRDSVMIGNQADGYLCYGTDCNAHLLSGNAFYYNVMWGIHDESSLGNTHIGNQLSNGGHLWANSAVPTTKNISTIARTLTSGKSQASVVLSSADTNIKLGSCVFIAGVTDTSFNTTTGQCFFVNSYTNSTHYGYEQPGAPANASSSGGTSRMGTFAEAYLSSGVDDGAQKVQTQGGFSPTIINQYVEGGQACKWGGNTLMINGANTPPCSGGGTWTGQFITTQGCTGLGGHLCMSPPSFVYNKELAGETNVKAGITTDLQYQFTWLNHSNSRTWIMYGIPSGTLGGSGQWGVQAGSGQTRLLFFGKDTNTGHTYLNAEGTGGKVIIGKNQSGSNAGTGGLEIDSGGASPATVATIDGAGKGTFNGGLVSAAATPTVAASQLGLGSTAGFGNGSSGTAVTTTTKNTGSGPTTPQTVVNYLKVNIGGTDYWVPLVQ